MLGITGKHLENIHRLTQKLDPDADTENLGAWGILFLCCGAFAGGNANWHEIIKGSDSFVSSTDLAKIMQGEPVCTSDDYAKKFSEKIAEWSNYDHAITVAENRMEKYKGKSSDTAYICNKTWLTLAYMLNSLQGMTIKELLGCECQTWVSLSNSKTQSYGWPELFFAAGLLLSREPSVRWHEMASAIHGMNKPFKEDVSSLYEHFAGRNPFTKPEKKMVHTDQLKKGTRIRLRNGWEAIVVGECNGNSLNAKVYGDFAETGSVYVHNIETAEVNGEWVDVELNEEQAQFQKEVMPFFDRNED